MDLITVLLTIVLGVILGIVGQGIRAIVGIKKAYEVSQEKEDWFKNKFDTKQLLWSLLIGSIAGVLASIALLGREINRENLLALVAAGYAGTDFIQGLAWTKFQKLRSTNLQ